MTDKKRPTTPAPSREELAEIRRENRKFTLRNVGQYGERLRIYCIKHSVQTS